MSDVFADTYYFVALLSHEGEDERKRAEEATLQRNGRLVTTIWVLMELANTLCQPRHRPLFLETLAALEGDPDSLIVGEESALFDEGVELYRARLTRNGR